MSDAKNELLTCIRTALHRGKLSSKEQSTLTQMMLHAPRGIIPAYLNTDKEHLKKLFIRAARLSASTVSVLSTLAEVANAIDQFLKENQLHNNTLQIAKELASRIDFAKHADFLINVDKHRREYSISINHALCGISETGTLVMVSEPNNPTLINFLANTHIVVLATESIVASYEDAWDLIRANSNRLPRTVNFITGPSRTADIEQRMLLGIHGPRKLHIILYPRA